MPKISQLEAATDITASDLMQVVDIEDTGMAPSGTNKKITAQLLADDLAGIVSDGGINPAKLSSGALPSGVTATATGSTTARTLANRFADTVNVKDFGAIGNGVANDTAALQAAINFASTNGGGTVFFPFGTYLVSAAIIIKNDIILDLGKSTIRLASGANDDVIRTVDFYNLIGTNNYSSSTPNRFVIQNGTIDGNAANQSPSNPDTCNGLALYAYGYVLRDVNIKDSRGHGIRREWGQYGEPELGMEGCFENIKIRNSWRHGIWDKGPHDSNNNNVTIINAGLESDDTYDGVRIDSWGNGRWFNLHVWSTSSTTNRPRFSLNNNSGRAELVNCHLEGARRQLRSTGNTYVSSSLIYANFSNNPQIELSGESNIISTSEYIANTSYPKATILKLGGDAQFAMSNIDMEIRQKSGGTSSPLIDVINSAGNNKINIRVVGHDSANMLNGSFDNFDNVSITQEFPDQYTYLQTPFERMCITSSGDVGIGTRSPSVKLDVRGRIRNNNRIQREHTNANDWIVHALDQNDSFSSTGGIWFDDSIDAIGLANENVGSVVFALNEGGVVIQSNFSERMRITNAGNVGIGTASPSSKLHVNGDLTVSSATTATSATAGTNGDVPAQVAGYLVVNINGTARKIPYYA